jgi:hypothetical protein
LFPTAQKHRKKYTNGRHFRVATSELHFLNSNLGFGNTSAETLF